MIGKDKIKGQRTGEMVQLNQQVVGLKTAKTKRKQVGEALPGSDQQFRALIENAQDAIVIMNPDATIRYESPSMARMTGRKAEDRIDKNPLEFCHPDDTASVMDAFIPLLENKVPIVRTELRLQHKNGRWITFELIGTNLIDDPLVAGIVLNLRDITERKQAEEESEKLLKTIETAREAMFITAADGIITYTNGAMDDLFGYKRGELIGKNPSVLNAGPTPEAVAQNITDTIEMEGYWQGEIHNKRKDGKEFTSYARITVFRDKEGKIVNFLATQHDITERKRVEEALRESEERFRALTESTSDFVWEVDLDGVYTYASPKVKDLLGYKPEEILGKTPFDFMPHEEAKRVEEEFRASVESRRPFAGLENTNMHKDGRLIVLETSGVPIFDQTGRLCGYRGIDRDITERRRAEEELIRLSNAVRMATDSIVISDLEAKIIEVNEATLKMYGTDDKGDLIGKNSYDLIAPEDREKAIASAKEVLERGYVENQEYHIITKDGSTVLVEMSTAIMKDGDGKPIGFVAVSRDITERKRMEQAIQESQEKLRIVFDTIGEGITVVDLAGNIMDVNETVLRMKGYSRKELIGRYGLDFVAEIDRARAIDEMMDFLKGQEEETPMREVTLLTKDGSEIPCEANCTLLRDSSGNIVGLISVERDITERKKAEKELRESEERYRDLVDKEKDIIYTLDAHGNITSANPAVSMLGCTPDQVIGKNFIELIPNEWQEKTVADFNDLLNTGEITAETVLLDKKGAPHLVEYSSTVISEGDRVIGTRGIVRDITERKKAEEELRQYSERLRVMAMQLSAAEDNERRRLAHELHDQVGQNLTALGINLSMVRAQLPEEAVAPVRSILDDSQSVLEQTAEIIRDVMAALQPPVLEDYGLVAALRWYADRFASRTGISVTVQGKDPSPRLNTSSENTLFRIVQETLTNVAKHAQATQVTVIVVVRKGAVRIVVTDDGVGFNVADVVNSDVQQGWGLTTMSERVNSLGGSFDIESRPGHGTRVVVEIGR